MAFSFHPFALRNLLPSLTFAAYGATTPPPFAVDAVNDRVPPPFGVAVVAAPLSQTMEVPSVAPVVAGVSLMVDPQTPSASATTTSLSPVFLPTAAVKVSATSSAPPVNALADVLPCWVADAAARGVQLTSV